MLKPAILRDPNEHRHGEMSLKVLVTFLNRIIACKVFFYFLTINFMHKSLGEKLSN